jgi:hypothetical protein
MRFNLIASCSIPSCVDRDRSQLGFAQAPRGLYQSAMSHAHRTSVLISRKTAILCTITPNQNVFSAPPRLRVPIFSLIGQPIFYLQLPCPQGSSGIWRYAKSSGIYSLCASLFSPRLCVNPFKAICDCHALHPTHTAQTPTPRIPSEVEESQPSLAQIPTSPRLACHFGLSATAVYHPPDSSNLPHPAHRPCHYTAPFRGICTAASYNWVCSN